MLMPFMDAVNAGALWLGGVLDELVVDRTVCEPSWKLESIKKSLFCAINLSNDKQTKRFLCELHTLEYPLNCDGSGWAASVSET